MGDVKFIKTTSAQLDNLPVVDGQLIVLTDTAGCYYDQNDTRYPVSSSGSGGHIIKDASGVSLAQRAALQFEGYLNVSDDSTHDATIVSAAPTTVTWQDYHSKTASEKDGILWEIIDYPDALDSIGIFTLKDQTLTFDNLVAEVPIPGITANTHLLVYYSTDSKEYAENARLVEDSATNKVVFTAENSPEGTITCDIIYWDDTSGGSSSGGSASTYTITCPTTGYTEQEVTIWGETGTYYTITITQDKDGNPLTNLSSDMVADYPINVSGTLTDFTKLYAYEIQLTSVVLYLTEVPTSAFDFIIRGVA